MEWQRLWRRADCTLHQVGESGVKPDFPRCDLPRSENAVIAPELVYFATAATAPGGAWRPRRRVITLAKYR
jgi:hypothetical protein